MPCSELSGYRAADGFEFLRRYDLQGAQFPEFGIAQRGRVTYRRCGLICTVVGCFPLIERAQKILYLVHTAILLCTFQRRLMLIREIPKLVAERCA